MISKNFEPHILLSGKHDFLGAVTGQLTSIKEKGELIQWFDLQGNEVKSGRILMSLMWLEATKDKTLLIGELSKNSNSIFIHVVVKKNCPCSSHFDNFGLLFIV